VRVSHNNIPFARGPTTGLRLLRTPVGSPSHGSGALEAVVEVNNLLLTEMDDPQVEILLLRACLGSAKMTNLTSVTPHDTVATFATAFDNSILVWDVFARTTSLTHSGCKPGCPYPWEDLD
jgi:hypothetical protein